MKNVFSKMASYLRKFEFKKLPFYICSGTLFSLLFFQNCGVSLERKNSVFDNPNTAPISSTEGKNSILVAPNTVKKKLINGVDVPGFEIGSWIYAFVDDQCVKDRKDIILNSPLYFLDPYLKLQFNFEAPVGVFNVSMISIQVNEFIEQSRFETAISLDNCATGSYVSATDPKPIGQLLNTLNNGSSSTWSQMSLDPAILQSLKTLTASTKVNVGISAPGFNLATNPPLPLSPNAVGLPTGDPDGLGTFLGSIIALPQNPTTSVQGVADGISQLIPVSLPTNYKDWFLHALTFAVIKQMVNRGAEVIVLPLWENDNSFCDPLIGQALYYAIERKVTVVVPAGSKVGRGGNPQAGEIIGPRDFSLFQASPTSQVSCWGRYFRGVITAGARLQNSTIEVAPFSNYGAEGVEILAPGQSVVGINASSQSAVLSNTEASAALTGGAIAHIISFYKSKGWFYSPWLIEDTLMNGSLVANNLPDSGKTVRQKKLLNFTTLKDFLLTLNAGTEENARNQATDNPESGQSINLSSLEPGEKPTKLDVFSKNLIVFVKDRSQFQAVQYFATGAVKVVTDQVTWSSSDPINFPVDSQGIVRPQKTGFFTLAAFDPVSRLTSSYTTQAVDFDTVSGVSSRIVRLELRDNEYDIMAGNKSIEPIPNGYKLLNLFIGAEIWAVYEDGISRKVTDNTVYSVMYNGQPLGTEFPRTFPSAMFLARFSVLRGGQDHELLLFYRGFQQKLTIRVPLYTFEGWAWSSNISSSSYNKPVISYNDTSIKLYNLGRWSAIQYKIPICKLNGKSMPCPANTVNESLWGGCGQTTCGYQASTTLPEDGLSRLPPSSGYGDNILPGNYFVDQKYFFWGDNSGAVQNSRLAIEVVDVPKIKEILYSAWSFGTPQRIGFGASQTVDPIQLAPVCSEPVAPIYTVNRNFGIEQFFRGQWLDSRSQVESMVDAGGQPFTSYIADPARGGVLIQSAANGLRMNFKVNDLAISKIMPGPLRITENAFDPDLNLTEKTFGSKNYITPKALPALPVAAAQNPRCAQAPAVNGSYGGTGTQADPFIICTWASLLATTASVSDQLRSGTHFALGADIDLLAVVRPTFNGRGLRALDGRNYRIKNGTYLDRENNVHLLKGFAYIHDLVFENNNLSGRPVGLIHGAKVTNIYAYDNILDGSYVSVVVEGFYARNVYTRNRVTYSEGFYGVGNYAIESFTSDEARYVGNLSYSTAVGVASVTLASGSNSVFVGGYNIGGVASSFCYKCFSAVQINSTNYNTIGGILIYLSMVGNLEVGESQAVITAVGGPGASAGGIVGRVGRSSSSTLMYVQNYDNSTVALEFKYGHIHILNSKFIGSITGTGLIGGVVGLDADASDIYFSNSDFTGSVGGAGIKGSLIGKASGQCVNSVLKSAKTRGVQLNANLPAVGELSNGSPQVNGVPF